MSLKEELLKIKEKYGLEEAMKLMEAIQKETEKEEIKINSTTESTKIKLFGEENYLHKPQKAHSVAPDKIEIDFDSLPNMLKIEDLTGWERDRALYLEEKANLKENPEIKEFHTEEDYVFGTRILMNSILTEMKKEEICMLKLNKKSKPVSAISLAGYLTSSKNLSEIKFNHIFNDVKLTNLSRGDMLFDNFFTKNPQVVKPLVATEKNLGEYSGVSTIKTFDYETGDRIEESVMVNYLPKSQSLENVFTASKYAHTLVKLLRLDARLYETRGIRSNKTNEAKSKIVDAKQTLFTTQDLETLTDILNELNSDKDYHVYGRNHNEGKTKVSYIRYIGNEILMLMQATLYSRYHGERVGDGSLIYDFTKILVLYEKIKSIVDSAMIIYRRRALVLMLHKFEGDRFLNVEGNRIILDEEFYTSDLATKETANRWVRMIKDVTMPY